MRVVAARASARARRARRMRTRVPAGWPASRGEATTSVDEADARAVRRTRLGRGRGLARRRRPRLPLRAAAAAAHGPRHSAVQTRRADACERGCGGSSPARPTTSSTCRSVVPDGFYGDCARALRGCRAARSSPTASSPRSPATRAPRAPPARSARAATLVAVRADAPRRRLERDRLATATSASSTSAACWRSRASLSDGALRRPPGRAGADRAAAPLLPARRDLRALPRLRRLAPARRQRRRAPRPRRARRPPGARSRCCATWACARRSAPTGAGRSTRRRATSCTSTSTSARSSVLREAGVLSPTGAPLERAAEARRRPLVLPRRLPARRAARRRLALGPARPAPRVRASERRRRRASSPTSRRAKACARRRRAAQPRGRLRQGPRGDRRPAGARRRGRHGAAPRGARRRLGDARERQPARERRRGEPRAHGARRARPARGDPRRSTSTACRAPLAEIAELRLRHPSASLRELAAKARPPITKAAAHRRLRAVVARAN